MFAYGFKRLLAGLMVVAALAGCSGGIHRTAYLVSAPPEVTSEWKVVDVKVDVPRTLVVSEEEIFFPRADIVWREDPPGDRYEQVAKIMRDAISKGVADLNGDREVVVEVTMARFHALTFIAETRAPSGVHDIEFTLAVRDAKSGEILFGPEYVEASFPALTGARMAQARAQGQTQKSQITEHVEKTIRAIFGIGADARETFSSLGG
ncbi:hypothetical protein LV82_00769 [Albidovulum inexpectatum]|uniref:Lipoprotein n=1 Tax=Albidovulum inexpectatum TaxID=196587 RepID=A0A2S5JJC3_9RHOB|nr:DUF6778 family protein [Albidovulum inexpectatum]PPB81560.1 hypothetical protein LV82_00769 [Albidovulum inexpectatum]